MEIRFTDLFNKSTIDKSELEKLSLLELKESFKRIGTELETLGLRRVVSERYIFDESDCQVDATLLTYYNDNLSVREVLSSDHKKIRFEVVTYDEVLSNDEVVKKFYIRLIDDEDNEYYISDGDYIIIFYAIPYQWEEGEEGDLIYKTSSSRDFSIFLKIFDYLNFQKLSSYYSRLGSSETGSEYVNYMEKARYYDDRANILYERVKEHIKDILPLSEIIQGRVSKRRWLTH